MCTISQLPSHTLYLLNNHVQDSVQYPWESVANAIVPITEAFKEEIKALNSKLIPLKSLRDAFAVLATAATFTLTTIDTSTPPHPLINLGLKVAAIATGSLALYVHTKITPLSTEYNKFQTFNTALMELNNNHSTTQVQAFIKCWNKSYVTNRSDDWDRKLSNKNGNTSISQTPSMQSDSISPSQITNSASLNVDKTTIADQSNIVHPPSNPSRLNQTDESVTASQSSSSSDLSTQTPHHADEDCIFVDALSNIDLNDIKTSSVETKQPNSLPNPLASSSTTTQHPNKKNQGGVTIKNHGKKTRISTTVKRLQNS